MGESTCLMPAFSYAPAAISNEAKQGTPMVALGESISFGRYMSESLEWEKWSIFSHKRYVEEAERFAQPGSVAQKKAFFEAHYKRKAAALLEQENALNTPSKQESGWEAEFEQNLLDQSQTILPNNQHFVDLEQKVKYTKKDFVINDDRCNSDTKPVELGGVKLGAPNAVIQREASNGHLAMDEKLKQVKTVEIGSKVRDKTDQETEDTALEGNPTADESLDKPENVEDEKIVKQDFTSSRDALYSLLYNYKSSDHNTASEVPFSPAESMAPTFSKKENNGTPVIKKPTMGSTDQKRSTPRNSLHSIIYSTPESVELTIPSMKKASGTEVQKHISAASHSENKRFKTQTNSVVTGSKVSRPKWHILFSVCFKFSSKQGGKLQSSSLSNPPLKTEERSSKGKQKHEQNFNTNQEQKVKLQAKNKDKGVMGIKKLCHSFCFKAQPSPHFIVEGETSNNQIRKNPVMHYPKPTKLG